MTRLLLTILISATAATVAVAPIASDAAPLGRPTTLTVELGGCAEALALHEGSARLLTNAMDRVPPAARTADVARRVDAARQELDALVAACSAADGQRGAVFDLTQLRPLFAAIVDRAIADVEALTRRVLDGARVRPSPTPTATRTPAPTQRGSAKVDTKDSKSESKSAASEDESEDDDSEDDEDKD